MSQSIEQIVEQMREAAEAALASPLINAPCRIPFLKIAQPANVLAVFSALKEVQKRAAELAALKQNLERSGFEVCYGPNGEFDGVMYDATPVFLDTATLRAERDTLREAAGAAEDALTRAALAIKLYSPDPTEPMDKIDAALAALKTALGE